jgi:hypothetical protein
MWFLTIIYMQFQEITKHNFPSSHNWISDWNENKKNTHSKNNISCDRQWFNKSLLSESYWLTWASIYILLIEWFPSKLCPQFHHICDFLQLYTCNFKKPQSIIFPAAIIEFQIETKIKKIQMRNAFIIFESEIHILIVLDLISLNDFLPNYVQQHECA